MDISTLFTRYRPYIAVVAAIAALALFLPGDDDSDVATGAGPGVIITTTTAPGALGAPASGGAVVPDGGVAPGQAPSSTVAGGGQAPAGQSSGGSGGAPATTAPAGGGTGGDPAGGQAPATTAPPPPSPQGQLVANCDPATGRIAVPSIYAPPCVNAFSGDNGGATSQGVTADSVKVVFFQPQPDPATEAALSAAGAQNSLPEQRAYMEKMFEFFNAHYETYGRTVELVIREGTDDGTNDETARADALAIATEDRPFAVLQGPASPAFYDELSSRGIICVCTVSLPQEFYEKHGGLVGYTPLMGSTQGYVHRAEYVGKRLAGRNAVHAGFSDATPLNTLPRNFGLLWYDTPDGAYKSGIDFFENELRTKYGVELSESISYIGFPDVTATQEGARPRIQRLKSSNITTVIFSGDPIAPAIFTQEATRQAYFPEWIITGSALTDTSIFARTYDQNQWDKAFGISFLVARLPAEQSDGYVLHQWQHGSDPEADNQYNVIYPYPFAFFVGLHLAGPELTPSSWVNGIFSYPPSGGGRLTAQQQSWGNHGLWPFTDYTAYDDIVEIWWDGTAQGEDETGNFGAGLYRYVDGGRRYLPGQQPSSEPKAFVVEGTVTGYDEPPPGEGRPLYPSPAGSPHGSP